ncbi:type III-B CRISPR module RAMP protein Cmr4 [Acetomicrobium sp.]|jgi:CRISPR-associated protein Cmr4|uniref:type III-B CRISPR module RAMP protein Cmr4 n=2 Tax=Acetomicrobium sp. TaxID=1872099 RepID=UPI0016AFF2DE|nr:type III-B CRISPR module RAMP protein Cmr4 [Acetomicrobium sp.]MDR9769306.1 type III-B CRISPR module RAMP protein Cmr4 [Acetomicrobium sp.]NLI42203.1 type III-B CRISPR module RAMP protein Cmr4 [Synergistaceae bacterium]HOQ38337.1 type III-B CRISPR module RAMP protein Cmr4 [Acetivibrio sp.]HPT76478.1 type III-B CRISPR module RAMP protein Cmr4 [Defluviitaleaceae bacterium]
MYKAFQPFFLIAEAPIHAGSGSEVGIVDLPIQRERHTSFPKIEGSGIKGCFREALKHSNKTVKIRGREIPSNDKLHITLVFGPEESGAEHAGCIAFTDARILFFPVKSLKGVFAWVTCPLVLARFMEDIKTIGGIGDDFSWDVQGLENCTPTESQLTVSDNKVVVLEEFTFKVNEDDRVDKIANYLDGMIFPDDPVFDFWKEKLRKDIIILSDDDFKSFITTSTEVIARTRIDSETGTVQRGALWTEEYLPQDTILYSIAMATHVRIESGTKGILNGATPDEEAQNVIEYFRQAIPEVIHIGGNQTIGKGIVRINMMNVGES